MSNGDVSPKYGTKPFTNCCTFESRITKVKAKVKDNRLSGLVFYTEHDGEFLKIEGSSVSTSSTTVALHETESIIGFKMRVFQGKLHGLSASMLSSKTIIESD